MREITIKWYGPFSSIDQIKDYYEGAGIYCISGVCARERKVKPQYIGISITDVAERLSDYWHTHKAVRDSGKCFYVGEIRSGINLKERLDLAENALIYHTKPSLNKTLVNRPPLEPVMLKSLWHFKTTGNLRFSPPKEFLFEVSPVLKWTGSEMLETNH